MQAELNQEQTPEQTAEAMQGMLHRLQNGASFGTAFSLDASHYEAIYFLGYQQYQQQHYAQAMRFFGFIVFHDQTHFKAMRGMASCCQMLGLYEEAMVYLGVVAIGEDDNGDVALQVVECLLHLGRKQDALDLLNKIASAAEKYPQDDYIKNKLSGLLAIVSKAPDLPTEANLEVER
jgi:tetratricopeptide (TPR) repeat protein